MLDNELIKIFYPIIKDGLIDAGLTNVVVRQSYQPTQQGAEKQDAVYFFKIDDKRYGWVGMVDKWDFQSATMTHTEIQHYETTFQVNALSTQDPANENSLTASDLVNIVSQIMQSYKAQSQLASNDVGILRITNIRNPYFFNDRDNFEASPSFDFTLSHKQIRETTSPIIESAELKIYQI
jgi:hypothetical protein